MKKIIAALTLILSFKEASGLPLSNPNETNLYRTGLWRNPCCLETFNVRYTWFEGWNARVGYYGDFVFDRHMAAGEDGHTDGRNLENTKISTNAGYLVFNFCNFGTNIDLFFTLGQSLFHTRQNSNVFTGDEGRETELHFKPAFSWSVGARSALYCCKGFTLGIEGQYFSSEPDISHFLTSDRVRVYYHDKGSHYEEWQVGAGVSYLIPWSCSAFSLSPYAGVKYSRTKWGLGDALVPDTEVRLHELHGKKNWGWALGVSVVEGCLTGVTVEARFADEKAFHAKWQIRF